MHQTAYFAGCTQIMSYYLSLTERCGHGRRVDGRRVLGLLLRRLGLHGLVQVSRQRCRRERRLVGVVERRRAPAGRHARRVQL